MAKTKKSASVASLPSSHVTPAPHATLVITEVTVSAATVYHRIHSEKYGATDFNPGFGNARFSPIKDTAGVQIPTIYAATTFEAAAMESVYHEVPFEPGFKQMDKAKFNDQTHSTVAPVSDLKLADWGASRCESLA